MEIRLEFPKKHRLTFIAKSLQIVRLRYTDNWRGAEVGKKRTGARALLYSCRPFRLKIEQRLPRIMRAANIDCGQAEIVARCNKFAGMVFRTGMALPAQQIPAFLVGHL